MRKLVLCIVCLAAMMAGTGLKAQEISITLAPGWNWISYTNAVPMEVGEALGDFTPVQGDIIKSKNNGTTTYTGTMWRGNLTHFMPGQGYKYFSARTETTSFVFAQAPSSFVTTAEPTDITTESAVVGGIVTIDGGNHIYARGVCWDTVQMPTVDDNLISNGIEVCSFTDTLIGLTSNTIYFVRAYVVTDYGLAYGDEQSFTTLDGSNNGNHEYVDLGLPSGTLWATCNVGANAPEEYGDYFAWGETEPKNYFDWSTYQHCNGSWSTLTKYCTNSSYGYNGFTDYLTVLQPEDDAATVNWGSDWHMPTKKEWQELYNNTTVTMTTQNGVYGILFTASNNNTLFLPTAGYRYVGNINSAGSQGYYWSSSLYTDYPFNATDSPYNARHFFFKYGDYSMHDYSRAGGLPVRAVRSDSQNNIPKGAINGLFSVGESQQVYFSQGNLQYQAFTNTWRFADNQYDYIGYANNNISLSYKGWIDLFGWGTSGWNNGNTYYHPWDFNNSDGSLYGPPGQYNLTGSYANADWGVYNPINNGGNMTNQWRTLTQSEWNYVFNNRTTTSGIRYVKAKVNDVNGVILLPDNWNTSTYSLNNTNTYNASFSSNTLTDSQWATLESAGAVFLPAAGVRDGTWVTVVGSSGSYMSTTCYNINIVYIVSFNVSSFNSNDLGYRCMGLSVRLVSDFED